MELLTKSEVAEYFRVNERTVARWLANGNLKGYKLGTGRTAVLRIPKSEVERFLKNSKVK
jgi:excisionase family DNA binding protein